MADTISTKRITDLPEDTGVNDNDLFMAGSNGTASLRKKKWSTLLAKIKSVLLANNLTTTTAGFALDARQGKALKDQLDQQNTNMKSLIWSYTVNAGSITVPANASYAFSGKAPSLEGYNAVGVLSVYHSDNDGRLAISKFYCEPDTGNYGAVIKNNAASQYVTNLYFVLLYVRDRSDY